MNKRAVRIANFSGYLGDRMSAFDEAMAGDPVDVLIGDYLAEITLAALSGKRQDNDPGGYVPYFLTQIEPHLAELAKRGQKVVVNAGGFNPGGLAQAVRALAAKQGVALRVAHVEGDNLLPELPRLQAEGHLLENLDTGAPLSSWGARPVTANAYLGGWGIAAALREGADIVICGRVTDASLALGPAAWWHGWREDDWHALAGAIAAGHIIECGAHATGGNFTGFARIPGMIKPGFPIAEVAADGSSVITKHRRDGGTVTVDTVTAQLVYEIQGPRYLNPDVTLHLDTVKLEQLGPDRVAVSGIAGSPPPPTTKVAVFAPIGYQQVMTVFVTGIHIPEKVALIESQVREMVAGPDIIDIDFTQFGTAAENPRSQWEATVALRIMATARTSEALSEANFGAHLNSLYLSSIPGYYLDTNAPRMTKPRPRIDYWPALLPMSAVPHRVVLDDGRTISIAPSSITETAPQPAHPEPDATASGGAAGDTGSRRLPLGTLAFARSGDKGGNSNVGIWVNDDKAWPWLRQTLTTSQLRTLAPELAELEIVRHEFPHLRAVHFVLRGLLGTGGASNLRADPVGKAIGEYLLAKHVDIPEPLL